MSFRKIGSNLLTVALLAVGLGAWVVLPWYGVVALAAALGAWLFLSRQGKLALAAAGVGIASLPRRWGASSVIVIGIAGVVGVLVAMLAMGEGFQATLKGTGSDEAAIILRGGSQVETNSVISRNQAPLIVGLPGIARSADGRPLASPEVSQVVNLPSKADGTDANVQMRGVGDEGWEVRPHMRLVQGRRFERGLREIATLRAIGFRGLPVVVAVMLETMLLALLGGLLGAGIAWLVFNGYTVSTLGQNFSQVVFQFRVSPELLWTGLKWALGIGLVGGLFPALRAARLPVTEALRSA